ncbi:hypothetical protein FLCH110379_15820 [Flavobacterium chungbukense]
MLKLYHINLRKFYNELINRGSFLLKQLYCVKKIALIMNLNELTFLIWLEKPSAFIVFEIEKKDLSLHPNLFHL